MIKQGLVYWCMIGRSLVSFLYSTTTANHFLFWSVPLNTHVTYMMFTVIIILCELQLVNLNFYSGSAKNLVVCIDWFNDKLEKQPWVGINSIHKRQNNFLIIETDASFNYMCAILIMMLGRMYLFWKSFS